MALGGQHVERVGADLCLISGEGHKRGVSQLCYGSIRLASTLSSTSAISACPSAS